MELERDRRDSDLLEFGASVGYVGRRGLHNWEVFDINQPLPGTVSGGVNANYVRPYKGFAAIQEEQSVGTSRYNALQVSWRRRFTNGFSFSAAYTLSQSNDNSSNYRDIVPNFYFTGNLWGPSEFDARHMLAITYTYDLPFFRSQSSLIGKLLGGWQINGIAQFQTGTPCGIGSNNDYAQVGEFGSFGCGNEGQFWVMNDTHRSWAISRGQPATQIPPSISPPLQIPDNRSLPSLLPVPSTINTTFAIRSMARLPELGVSGCSRSSSSMNVLDLSFVPKPTISSTIPIGPNLVPAHQAE